MSNIKIGIIICDRYSSCAGGKCFRSLKERVGGFKRYENDEVEIAGFTSCGGCPGGNIEYSPEEMKKNGVDVIHFATGMIVGYPPCPRTQFFKEYIEKKFGIDVVIGTHPIPEKYLKTHKKLKTWQSEFWKKVVKENMSIEKIRLEYN
ncbi:MAG TPA: CGGC domain-containing protein [Candidatus Mcinerneyibacterium sp.]|nr:CGGC domain-containing protein [Candidatus Mcinerneyibacterium sp.]